MRTGLFFLNFCDKYFLTEIYQSWDMTESAVTPRSLLTSLQHFSQCLYGMCYLFSAICYTCMVVSVNIIWCCNSNWDFSCKLLVLLTCPERERFLSLMKVGTTHSPSLWEGMILSLEAYLSSKRDTYTQLQVEFCYQLLQIKPQGSVHEPLISETLQCLHSITRCII